MEHENNDEDNNESVKVGPRAELAQFVKRKKPPVHLDRIVDYLYYKVLSVFIVYFATITVPTIHHFQKLFHHVMYITQFQRFMSQI